ncbi:MAG TPA: DUF192 domain-containing protein [Thermoanaerobaculia bacterium]|jgi:uncharacterized membrane protein (UPF0127 family)|nr:DUF192 domain-containing protein [Thermoanaerobaculia bacterium]
MKPLLVMLLMIGCTKTMPPATNTSTTAAATTTSTSGPRVTLPDGFVVNVEIAADGETRAQGLMYRDHLSPGMGMLFFFGESGEYPFWMKNTRIPLDIIWIDESRRIAHVKHEVPPCRIDDCPSYPPNAIARYVLELAGGEAKKHGLKAGDVLQFEQTENVVAR